VKNEEEVRKDFSMASLKMISLIRKMYKIEIEDGMEVNIEQKEIF